MNSLPLAPRISLRRQPDGSFDVVLSGAWTRSAELPPLEPVCAELSAAAPKRVRLVTEDLSGWDSRLPIALIKLIDRCKAAGIESDGAALPPGVQALLRLARAVPEHRGARRGVQRIPIAVQIGQFILGTLADARTLVGFIGEAVLAAGNLVRGRARFRGVDVVIAIQAAGPAALAIVTLISVLVGMILAFVGAAQLRMFGAAIYIADLVGLGMAREMGPLMTAVIMAGRTGAAYAAQIGTMNVNSEIDALRTLGVSPMEFLVLPRIVALMGMMPLLGIYAVFMGILGGGLVSTLVFDIPLVQFLHGIGRSVHLFDFGIGVFKCFVFAGLIAVAGCMRGMLCGRSASAVGDAATAGVVDGIVYIVVADSIITLICNRLGV